MRCNPDAAKKRYEWMASIGLCQWHKHRSYKTRELAEKNLSDMHRKWNVPFKHIEADYWQFEIRVKD